MAGMVVLVCVAWYTLATSTSLPREPHPGNLFFSADTNPPDTSRFPFSTTGLDTTGNLVANGRARYFIPFGENLGFQAGAEYFRFLGRQEGQFDVGLVDRYKSFQAGLFSSFKRVEFKEYSAGGTLGQASVAMDYLFSRGRIGVFGTKSFLDNPVLQRMGISRTLFRETYLSVVDQVGGSTQIGLHKDSYIEGNLGALFRRGGSNRPGGSVRFVQPLNAHWAFTVEAGLNETLVGADDNGRFVAEVEAVEL